MRLFGIIGRPLGHSFSKDYFTAKFSAEGLSSECRFENFPLATIDDLPEVFAAHPELEGFSVTIPYKKEIIPMLAGLSDEARAIGAANCVRVVREVGATRRSSDAVAGVMTKENATAGGRAALFGYNTDAHGFEVGLDELLGETPIRALVLGAGGASAAVMWALRRKNIEYTLISRTAERADQTAVWKTDPSERAVRLTYADLTPDIIATHKLIINATPLGTWPEVDGKPDIPYEAVGKDHFLYDLVYNPAETAFLKEGLRRGAAVINGEKMLRAQAEKAWEIWNAEP